MGWSGLAAIGSGVVTYCFIDWVGRVMRVRSRYGRMTKSPGTAASARTSWWARRSRARRLEAQLESGLLLLAGLTRAGAQPAEAMAVAASELPSPLADELRSVRQQYEAGRSLPDALVEVGRRSGLPLFARLGMVVDLCQTIGSDPAPLFESLADRVREDMEFRRELGQRTSELRFTGKILLVLPWGLLGLMWVVSRPSLVESLNHAGGRSVLLGALLLWLAGGWWMARIIDADSLLGE